MSLLDDVVRMGNQIARQFTHLPPEAAAVAVATHIANFWDPRMRATLLAHIESGGEGVDEVLAAAAADLDPTARPA